MTASPMHGRFRRTGTPVVALVAVLALGSCGSGGSGAQAGTTTPPSSTSSPAASSSATSSLTSSPATSSPATSSPAGTATGPSSGGPQAGDTVSGKALGQRITSAVKQKQTAHVSLQQNLGGTSSTGTGQLKQDDQGLSMAVMIKAGGRDISLRLLPSAFYLSSGQKIAGKSWLKISPDGKDPLSRSLAPLFATIQRSGALTQQAKAYAAVDQFTVVGTEQVDGVRTTHYKGSVPKSAVIAAVPGQYRSMVAQQITGAAPIELWVDDAGLPRRVQQTSPLKTGKTVATTEYSQWGEPVDISAPPASDTTTPPGS